MADILDLDGEGLTGTLEVKDITRPDGTPAVLCEVLRPLSGLHPRPDMRVYGYLTFAAANGTYTLVPGGKGAGRCTRLYNDIVQYRLTPAQATYIGTLLAGRAAAYMAELAKFANEE